MASLSRSGFNTTYADASGTFADNTTRLISEADLRAFSTDIKDSFVNVSDDVKSSATGAEMLTSDTKIANLFLNGAFVAFGTLTTAQVTNSNSSPITLVAAPGSNNEIVPIAIMFYMRYGSAPYATNTTFRLEINGIAVTATNTAFLPGTTDRTAIMYPIDVDTTTDLKNKALVFEAQTGNPTGGTDTDIHFTVIYRVGTTLDIA